MLCLALTYSLSAYCTRAVEFYFSDANLPFDKFLFTLTRKDNGWAPIKTLASFKRMKPMSSVLSTEEIAAVLRTSQDFLEVDEEGATVRRKKELVPVKDAFNRSAYVVSTPGLVEKESMRSFECVCAYMVLAHSDQLALGAMRARRHFCSPHRVTPSSYAGTLNPLALLVHRKASPMRRPSFSQRWKSTLPSLATSPSCA